MQNFAGMIIYVPSVTVSRPRCDDGGLIRRG
jgi:hypothetical protein